jgi:hypothetical protein
MLEKRYPPKNTINISINLYGELASVAHRAP